MVCICTDSKKLCNTIFVDLAQIAAAARCATRRRAASVRDAKARCECREQVRNRARQSSLRGANVGEPRASSVCFARVRSRDESMRILRGIRENHGFARVRNRAAQCVSAIVAESPRRGGRVRTESSHRCGRGVRTAMGRRVSRDRFFLAAKIFLHA